MANPQWENGFVKIANEIQDAFIGSKITIPAEVRRIVDFVIRQTYGFNKKEDIIALSQFALATGLKKPSVIRAIHKAIFMRLISRTANGKSWKYRFCKDFTLWKPLAPRLTISPTANGVSPTANESLAPRLPTKDSKDIIQKTVDFSNEKSDPSKNMKKLYDDDGFPIEGRVIDQDGTEIAPPEKQKPRKGNDEPMDLQGFIRYCRASKRPALLVIADYAEEKQVAYTHKIQWLGFIHRNIKPATALVPYTPEQIHKAMKKIYEARYIEKWGLETLLKYLE